MNGDKEESTLVGDSGDSIGPLPGLPRQFNDGEKFMERCNETINELEQERKRVGATGATHFPIYIYGLS